MMPYQNEKVRRQDRLMDRQQAIDLLQSAEYGILSMATPEGTGYGIPLNYVWDGDRTIYIHCAPEGRKLRNLEVSPHVSFCIVGQTHLLPSNFTTEYESVIVEATANIHISDEEKRQALSSFIAKLSPNDLVIGEKYIEKSFHRVNIIRLDCISFSGKRKKVIAPPHY